MESTNMAGASSSRVGLESPTARAIMDSMGAKRPVDARKFLDIFINSFAQKRRARAEKASVDELKAIEASIITANQDSAQVCRMECTIKHRQRWDDLPFDLNEVHNIDAEYNENYDHSNNRSTQADVAGSSAHAGDENERRVPDELLDDAALNPEPPTAEELEMDRMFAENKYPTMEQISQAPDPQIGMEFDSRDEAFFFFAVYARRKGFAIKKDSSYTSNVTKTVTRQAFSCNRGREEVHKDTALRKRKTCKIVQTNCKVKIYVKEHRGKWRITSVHLDHNHALAPSQWIVRFMKCHRSMSEQDKMLIQILQETRVPPRNIMKIFRKERGSFRGVPFDAKYLANKQYKEREKLKNKDIEELLALIKEEKKNRPGFFHSFDIDEDDNSVRSIFWTDNLGKANYSQFGRFVSFDTTFSTNQYGMPFAPIVGVDNYGKTVIFGAALLKDETEESFTWMLKEFVAVMGNNHPETIITDQDVAIGNAIREALPFTIHRYCNFHIGRNIKQNLAPFFATRGTFHDELRSLIRNSFTPEEFEAGWFELLQKYDAVHEPHLQRIFEIRDQWVPAYFMHTFFPFTSSTGRSESTNYLFKSYVKRKDSVTTFFREYMIIQEKKQADIDRLREKSEFKESQNWGYNPMEAEAMKIYTYPIYSKFAEEMKKTTAYRIDITVPHRLFRVLRIGAYDKPEFPRTEYRVEISDCGSIYTCSCSKMFRDGIQCCHVLKVATEEGLTELPTSFILPRWTTAAGQEVARLTEKRSQTGSDITHLAVRHAIEMSKVSHMLSRVCTDDLSYDLFSRGIEELKKVIVADTRNRIIQKATEVRKRKKIDDPVKKTAPVEEENTRTEKFQGDLNMPPEPDTEATAKEDNQEDPPVIYKDPPQSGNRGFNIGQRPMSMYEKSARKIIKNKKPKLCGRCRKPGHTRPWCPDNKNDRVDGGMQ